MKIGVIGASGKAGSRIVREAGWRRHEVTAIVRDRAKIADPEVAVLEKDLYDLTAEDLKEFDAVVSAFGTASDPESARMHQSALDHLIGIMEKLPDVRLMVVGGAASLYTDMTRRHLVLESIPPRWQAVPANMKEAFDRLRESKASWTYFSPAVNFDPDGPRTGKYRTGRDVVLHNSGGESYLSYADYAVAMLDEIEEGRFVRKRFTAVSEKEPNRDGYYGTEPEKPVFEGLSQYCPPPNYELAGRNFRLVMDNSGDITVRFLTGNQLELERKGQRFLARYDCAKGADLAYFVNLEAADSGPRHNVTLLLDLMTRLVTVVDTYAGYREGFPTLVDHIYDFGAIDMPGFSLPWKRHGYTTDLVGKRIQWHYSPDFSIIHVYYHPNYIRATFSPEAFARMKRPAGSGPESRSRNPYDEKAVYVKMREGLYIVSFTEQNYAKQGRSGNSLLFMMDTDRLHDVGRSFGYGGQPGDADFHPENYLFAAYGEYMAPDGDEQMESEPPFYTV